MKECELCDKKSKFSFSVSKNTTFYACAEHLGLISKTAAAAGNAFIPFVLNKINELI